MTSLERVLTTLSHKEPDRVPLFLLLTMHGAKEMGVSIQEYFSDPMNVVEGQLRMRAKYRHDCLYNFYYAPLEVEAWGAEVLYMEDGPPNSGRPFIDNKEAIKKLVPPRVKETPCLQKVLKSAQMLKNKVVDEVPIIGVVMSPFSLPVMQMGFNNYIELMYEEPELFDKLMEINESFCIEWANAQLEAGSTAIVYFDPISSPGITPREKYLKTGYEISKRVISKVNGSVAIHFASDRCLPISRDLPTTGTVGIGVSVLERLDELKEAFSGKLSLVGNLNGIEMHRWTKEETESIVKKAIADAGVGGGFILSDNHGEIPWQTPEEVLLAISESVHKWGNYPLDWIKDEDN